MTIDPPSPGEIGDSRRSSPWWQRVRLAVLLPVWIVIGFYLSQYLLLGGVYALDAANISLAGINPSVIEATMAALVYLFTLAIVVGIPIAIKQTHITLVDLGLQRLMTWRDTLFALSGFVVYIMLAGVFIYIANILIPGFDAEEVQEIGFQNLAHRYEYVLAFITLVIVAPVAEEMLMRGYLYGRLRKIMPIIGAVLVTSVLFAALHLQWNVAVDVFALSLVLTTLREVTGSIWTSILVHMMKNGLAFYLLFINTTLFRTIGG